MRVFPLWLKNMHFKRNFTFDKLNTLTMLDDFLVPELQIFPNYNQITWFQQRHTRSICLCHEFVKFSQQIDLQDR